MRHTATKGSAWSYRCFNIRGVARGLKATNVFPALSPDVPRSFVWNYKDDRDGLRTYIDAILIGRRAEAAATEANGAVSEVELFHYDRPENTVIKVSIRRFVDFLMLRDQFDVPLWGKVHFITDGTNIIPREFVAALGQMLGDEGKFLNPNKPWRHCSEVDLKKMGLSPGEVTSGMYRRRASSSQPVGMSQPDYGIPEDSDAPPVAPRELEIWCRKKERYTDLMTKVIPDEGAAYHARRIINTEGIILWSGTAFAVSGPWRVWERRTAELLALGLDL